MFIAAELREEHGFVRPEGLFNRALITSTPRLRAPAKVYSTCSCFWPSFLAPVNCQSCQYCSRTESSKSDAQRLRARKRGARSACLVLRLGTTVRQPEATRGRSSGTYSVGTCAGFAESEVQCSRCLFCHRHFSSELEKMCPQVHRIHKPIRRICGLSVALADGCFRILQDWLDATTPESKEIFKRSRGNVDLERKAQALKGGTKLFGSANAY